MKIFKILIIVVVSLFSIFSCSRKKNEAKVRIAIFQHIQHPALDSIKDNIIYYFEKNYDDYHITEYNSQGDITAGINIINQINNMNFDVVIAIATPSAQFAAQHIKNTPIVFSAVTDPIAAGLVDDPINPKNNITGVSDAIDAKQQIEFIIEINSNIKNVGILYNTTDANSQIIIANLKNEAEKNNLNIISTGITAFDDVYDAALSTVPKVDAILMILDNTVATNFSSLLKVCKKFNKPLLAIDKTFVDLGADAGLSIDYNYLAYLTYEIAEKIINGIPPENIPVKTIVKYEIYYSNN